MAHNFFLHFQQYNGFRYDSHKDPYVEFERLADHMHWKSSSYTANLLKFKESLRTGFYNSSSLRNYEESSDKEPYDINDFWTIQDYFHYFKRNYGFSMKRIGNVDQALNRHYYEEAKFQRIIEENEQRNYLKRLFEECRIQEEFDEVYSLKENFAYLSESMNWMKYKIRKDEFQWLVGEIARERLSSLKELHKIIRKYKMLDLLGGKLPETIEECRDFLKENLFVNIFEFIFITRIYYKKQEVL